MENNSVCYSMLLEDKSIDVYRHLMTQRITCCKEYWYCYLCDTKLQNLAEVKCHLEETHVDFKIRISDRLDSLAELPDNSCIKLVKHGIVQDLPNNYFCIHCQCLMSNLWVVHLHLKEKKHQKSQAYIGSSTIKKKADNIQQNLRNDISEKERNVNAFELLAKIQTICENLLKDSRDIPASMQDEISRDNSTSVLPLTPSKDNVLYKRLMAQRITLYNGQWYCYLCKAVLRDIVEAKHHSQEVHPDIQTSISNFLNNFRELSDKKCQIFLEHGIIIKELPTLYFCIYCQCWINGLRNITTHLKKAEHEYYVSAAQTVESVQQSSHTDISSIDKCHRDVCSNSDISTECVDQSRTAEVQTVDDMKQESVDKISNLYAEVAKSLPLNLRFTNIYKYFIAHYITRYYTLWYCYICQGALQDMEVERHLRENHADLNNHISDLYQDLDDVSNMECRMLLNYGMVVRCPQNYLCIPCQCSMESLYQIDQHVKGDKHKKYVNNISESLKNVLKDSNDRIGKRDKQSKFAIDVGDATQHFNKPGFSAEVQTTSKEKLVERLSYSSDSPNVYRDTLSSNAVNEENDENDENDDVSNVNKTPDAVFCVLCDDFVRNISMRKHMLTECHVLDVIKASDPQYIIKLGATRKIIRPLQLNVRKLDDTVWSNYTSSTTLACDKCNGIIQENDLVKHEIILHKDCAESSTSSGVNTQDSVLKTELLLHIDRFKRYPMFKCTICNEIMHGVSLLENHFSGSKHQEKMLQLMQSKQQERDQSTRRDLELLEFLDVISLKDDNGTLRAMEQPIIYIKRCNVYGKGRRYPELSNNMLIYICVTCQCVFSHIQHALTHLKNATKHLCQYESILHTYNLMYHERYLTPTMQRECDTVDGKQISPSVCTADLSTTSSTNLEGLVEACCSARDNNHLTAMNANSEDNTLHESHFEEKAGDLFKSPDTSTGMNMATRDDQSIQEKRSSLALLQEVPDLIHISAQDLLDEIYRSKYQQLEEIMSTCKKTALREMELYSRICVPLAKGNVLCLGCDVAHAHDLCALYEHMRSTRHCGNAHRRAVWLIFEETDGERSAEWLQELIEMDRTMYAKCYACNVKLQPKSDAIAIHARSLSHATRRERLLGRMEDLVEKFKILLHSMQYYSCLVCDDGYSRKSDFMEHLVQQHVPTDENLQFDFCVICATWWYAERKDASYAKHSRKYAHRRLLRTNHLAVKQLPETLHRLLNNVDEIVARLLEQSDYAMYDIKINELTGSLDDAFQAHNLPVEICIFGSRLTGLALANSDIDIYINFGDRTGTGLEVIKSRSKQIQDCIRTDRYNWRIKKVLETSRTPIIKLEHKLMGLDCDLSFMHGLSVENSKFVRFFHVAYPPCRKFILFLKEWMSLRSLNDSGPITNYALIWLAIFYLQVRHNVPSVAALIKSHNKSKLIGGWETEVDNIVPIDVPELPVHELLLGFFVYYGEFDFMRCVACPLLGEVCYKKSFMEVLLSEAMALYISQLSTTKVVYFRIDTAMCVQDPFDLSHNLTKAIPALILEHFKRHCNESASIIRNVISSKKGRFVKEDKTIDYGRTSLLI